MNEIRQTPLRTLPMDRRGFYSVLTALVLGSIWLIPLASVSPTTPYPVKGIQSWKQQGQSHQASRYQRDFLIAQLLCAMRTRVSSLFSASSRPLPIPTSSVFPT